MAGAAGRRVPNAQPPREELWDVLRRPREQSITPHRAHAMSDAERTRMLVATDGSPAATAAVEEALKLAAAIGGDVRFIHASAALADDLFDGFPETGPPRDAILARDPVLKDAAERAAARGVAAEVEVISDAHANTADLAATIAGIAQGVSASMIVVGSRGRGTLQAGLLGSVSHNLIKWSPVPILIVNPPPEA
jgi:nucleotide-binding universal stress UspA family protein